MGESRGKRRLAACQKIDSVDLALMCPKAIFDKTENGHGDVPKGCRKVRHDWLKRMGMVED